MIALALLLSTTSVAENASDTGDASNLGEHITTAHAIAMYGEPKYATDFQHFAYVNLRAPRGGVMRRGTEGSFDSFHPFISRGDAVATGSIESLLTFSADELYSGYGLLAERITWPRDRSWVIFDINPKARWHDGKPVLADDVVWSFEILTTKGTPQYRIIFAGVKEVKKISARRVQFVAKQSGVREFPLLAGQLPILPRHYWQGRDFTKTTLEAPLGSGPYRVKSFEAGRSVTLQRVANYWGRDLPVNRGLYNFDELRTNFYRDITAIRLALQAGELDFRHENQAKAWALDYDVSAVHSGRLLKKRVRHYLPTGMQAFLYNIRRVPFDDVRVREALSYAFDFEWTNRNLFFGQYKRTLSYFSNSSLAASGLPQGTELEILQRYRAELPERLFKQEFHAPITDGSGWPRANLKKATTLLREAGWEIHDFKLVHKTTGEPLRFEILLSSPSFERIVLPFIHNLERLGVEARVRLVDPTQYINRVRSFDFDMIVHVYSQSEIPGNEQRSVWGSTAATQPGSRNLIGIANPVVDELVEGIVQSQTLQSLHAYTSALDRVLLWNFYLIPHWHLQALRVLYWDKFAHPQIPVKAGILINRWWYDEARAAALENNNVHARVDTQVEGTE